MLNSSMSCALSDLFALLFMRSSYIVLSLIRYDNSFKCQPILLLHRRLPFRVRLLCVTSNHGHIALLPLAIIDCVRCQGGVDVLVQNHPNVSTIDIRLSHLVFAHSSAVPDGGG